MKPFFIFIIILLTQTVFAQQLTPSVISAGGKQVATGNVFYSYTIGELVTPLASNNVVLTQGFEQPAEISIEENLADTTETNFILKAYPNPTNSFVNINITSQYEILDIKTQTFDITGKQIYLSSEIYRSENYGIAKLDFSNLQIGQYFVKIIINQEKIFSYKIIKN